LGEVIRGACASGVAAKTLSAINKASVRSEGRGAMRMWRILNPQPRAPGILGFPPDQAMLLRLRARRQ
jgi:hypothetical protein